MEPIKNSIFDKDKIKAYEALMCYGNGYMNVRASFEFDVSYSHQNEIYTRMPANVTLEKPRNLYGKWGIFILGIEGRHPLLNIEMVNLPYFLGVNIYIDNFKINIADYISEFSQELNIENSTYNYSLKFTYDSEVFQIESTRIADRYAPNCHYQEFLLLHNSSRKVQVESFVDTNVTTNGFNHFKEVSLSFLENSLETKQINLKTDLDVEIFILQNDFSNGNLKRKEISSDRISKIYEAGKEFSLVKNTYINTKLDEIQNIFFMEYKINLDNHNKLWKNLWDTSDVIITGNEKMQKDVRFAIYHMLRAKKENDEYVAIDAKGAAGEAYYGHFFWDTEIYLLPFFIYTNPVFAKELLMFRVHSLDKAKENAKKYGCNGAKFPWEASSNGMEQCSNWQYSDLEIHVSFDIAYAMYQYYKITGDKESTANYFLPVMDEICQYIISRGYYQKDGSFHINGVMGPDEYLVFVDDNAYTNYLAKYTLEKTVKLFCEFNINCANKDEYLQAIENFYLPIDEEHRMIWQCNNFDSFESIDFNKIWKDRSCHFGTFISQEKNYRSKALKQGDVICLLYLFENNFDEEYIHNAIDYYLPITTHDSSLSYIIHSIIFSKINDKKLAYEYFLKAVGIDFDNLDCKEGIHIANCGGIYQAIIYGFAGLVNPVHTGNLVFKPSIPDGVKEIKFKMYYRNILHTITISEEDVIIEKLSETI